MQHCCFPLCTQAGTHGNPAWPLVRFCLAHKAPPDVLLITDTLDAADQPAPQEGDHERDE